MKKQDIIFHADGENQSTFGPLCFLENFTGNMEETVQKFVSWDCDIYTTIKKHKVCTVEIPDWMNEQDFLNHFIDLKFSRPYCPDVINWNRTRFFNFSSLGEKYKYFIGWLFEKNTKNAFMLSIREQVETWLNEDTHKFGQPLSIGQFQAATKYCPLWEAKQISTKIYYSF